MKNDNLNEIAKLEKAIKDKYGDQAIQNPKKNWNKEKEVKYLKDLKEFYNREDKSVEFEDHEGFLLKETTKKKQDEIERHCPECGRYSFITKDDLYMTKFKCCFQCYVKFVQGREERWKSGWRPNN